MNPITLETNYFHNDILRKSFNDLAIVTFGLDFEPWYQSNAYCKRYIPYSIVSNQKVVSNVSVSKLTLVIRKKLKSAIQIGTVMTDKNHRNLGYSQKLLEQIISVYENKCDLIFLYANQSVLDFYPKFGFKRIIEHSYTIEASTINPKKVGIQVLDPHSNLTKWNLKRLANNRKPVSTILGAVNDRWPLMTYFNKPEWELYHIIDDDVIVVGAHTDGIYHVYDIISNRKVMLDDIINKTIREDDKTVRLHFVPDGSRYKILSEELVDDDNALFVLSKENFTNDFLFPKTLHT